MSNRMLVWPWHGRWAGGAITLTNSETRPYPIPSLQASAISGPGDTHLFETPVAPISASEAAQAPAGGEWWAGKALISGGYLYGAPLPGWIYQAPLGECWSISIEAVSVLDSITTGKLVARRFGQFIKPPSTAEVDFTLGAGKASYGDAQKVFADLRSTPTGVLRLHSTSKTGRHAVLALMTYQNTGSNPDRRPRAYRYYLAAVSGAGSDESPLVMTISDLYGIADIKPDMIAESPSGSVKIIPKVRGEEVSRVPYYKSGVLAGYDVSYNFDPVSGFTSGSASPGYTMPGTYRYIYRWMIMVRFVGEVPTPVYISATSECVMPYPELTWETTSPQIRREPLSGTASTLSSGSAVINGSVETAGTFGIVLEGAESPWSKRLTAKCTSAIASDLVSNTFDFEGVTATIAGLELSQLGRLASGSLSGDATTRRPYASFGINNSPAGFNLSVNFDMYSNNLVGVAVLQGGSTGDYIGGFTPQGFISASGAYSGTDVGRYGSYNPAKSIIEVGSLVPVGWV